MILELRINNIIWSLYCEHSPLFTLQAQSTTPSIYICTPMYFWHKLYPCFYRMITSFNLYLLPASTKPEEALPQAPVKEEQSPVAPADLHHVPLAKDPAALKPTRLDDDVTKEDHGMLDNAYMDVKPQPAHHRVNSLSAEQVRGLGKGREMK